MSNKHPLLVFVSIIFTCLATTYAQDYTSQNLFYMVGSESSYESFLKHADEVSIICPAAYQIDKYGVITGFVDPRVLRVSREKGIKVMPLVASFDQEGIHTFLTNNAARQEAIRLMLFYGREFDFWGWQFDLENVHFTDRDSYTSFYRQAADSLHKYGFKISMAVVKSDQPAPESGNPSFQEYRYENSRGAYDIPAIASAGDFISFMTYDENNGLTPPGPVAGIPWMFGMVKYLLKIGVSPDKISLGIPTYSDYWYPAWNPKQGGHSTRSELSYASAESLLSEFGAKERWMQDQEVNYAYWEEGGVFNWLFLENGKSFAPKLELAKEYHLLGISVWVLGTEDPAVWNELREAVKTARIP